MAHEASQVYHMLQSPDFTQCEKAPVWQAVWRVLEAGVLHTMQASMSSACMHVDLISVCCVNSEKLLATNASEHLLCCGWMFCCHVV